MPATGRAGRGGGAESAGRRPAHGEHGRSGRRRQAAALFVRFARGNHAVRALTKSARRESDFWMRLGLIALSTAMIAAGTLALGVPASAAPAACAAPVPSPTQPGYTIADPHCDFGTSTPFAPLTDEKGRQISR